MIRGIYITASSMMAEMQRQEMVTNNLANLNTPGFKQDRSYLSTFRSMILHAVDNGEKIPPYGGVGLWSQGTGIGGFTTNLHQGGLRSTERKLDFAINGEGFFILNTPTGAQMTRNGQFHLDAQNRLVSSDGHLVVGEDGGAVTATAEGELSQNIAVVQAQNGNMVKQANGLFTTAGGLLNANGSVAQGYLEQSNVDQVGQITESITIARAFEAGQRVIAAQDDLLGKAVNEVGKV